MQSHCFSPCDHQLLGCPRTRTVGAGCCAAEIWIVGWVLLGATPIQAGTCRWRCSGSCADAAVWQGSEEPGQLLLIKSQLWFLSGEPLSKGIRREAQRTCSFPSMTPTHLPGLPYTLPPPEPDEGWSCSLPSYSSYSKCKRFPHGRISREIHLRVWAAK